MLIYIVDGVAALVIAVAVARVVVRRHRNRETDDWSEDQKPNIAGNIAGVTRR